jgi:NAD(P)-dependent dehydrogenase (short-subunit alcohol dehydrogenase family)
MRLKNKVAIVTGSTSGIGLAIAKLFAIEGAKVVIAARKEELAKKIVSQIKEEGGEATFIKLEVTDQKQWESAIKQVKEIYGSLHILVNNAATNELCALPNVDLDQWNKIMAINVTGPMIGIQTCAPLMKESGGGSIINIASLGGMHGTPSTAYTTSKWALRGLSGSAAYGLSNWGIRSNVICPGFIENTNMTNAIEAQGSGQNPLANFSLLGRSGKTMELAQAALFFASDESSYVTGIDMPVDGGLYDAGVYSLMRSKFAMLNEEKKIVSVENRAGK